MRKKSQSINIPRRCIYNTKKRSRKSRESRYIMQEGNRKATKKKSSGMRAALRYKAAQFCGLRAEDSI